MEMTMELGVSYHNHSTWSDGADTMEDMVAAAREAGLRVFGISDHYVPHPTLGQVDWSMPLDRVAEYLEQVTALKKAYETDSFKVLAGLEVDFFPENSQEIARQLRAYPLDYLIGSVHYVDDFPIDNSAEDWEALGDEAGRDVIFHGYWQRMLSLCQSGLYDIVGHLDLPKKYDYHAGYDVTDEVEMALQALKSSGMKMEVNTAGWDKPCREAYPSDRILTRALQLGIPVVVSMDAHAVDQVVRHVDDGWQHIRCCGGL